MEADGRRTKWLVNSKPVLCNGLTSYRIVQGEDVHDEEKMLFALIVIRLFVYTVQGPLSSRLSQVRLDI